MKDRGCYVGHNVNDKSKKDGDDDGDVEVEFEGVDGGDMGDK